MYHMYTESIGSVDLVVLCSVPPNQKLNTFTAYNVRHKNKHCTQKHRIYMSRVLYMSTLTERDMFNRSCLVALQIDTHTLA